jgi:hypothetical protein
MNDYQKEQLQAWQVLIQRLKQMPLEEKNAISREIQKYLDFRIQVDVFLNHYFSKYCTTTCYESNRSACCSKDGIVTFWADLVITAIAGEPRHPEQMIASVQRPYYSDKCIYLTPKGCCWHVRPLVCCMFLCDQVQQEVFSTEQKAAEKWAHLCRQARSFRWPDRPVLFDRLERVFITQGCRSSLMYLHNSPGLLRVKQQAGQRRKVPAQ